MIIVTFYTLILRPFSKNKGSEPKTIVLYGHKFNGNLKALYIELQNHTEFKTYFLSMDHEYANQLRKDRLNVLSGIKAGQILSKTSVIVTDHGLHSLELLLHFTGIKFIDVWHGIPFKGFDKDDFRVQHKYDEIWVTSENIKKIYIEKFGFHEEKVKITGYARTDKLVKKHENIFKIKKKIGISNLKKPVILFAPTWTQDYNRRSIYPFGLTKGEFTKTLTEISDESNCYIIIRSHLNTEINERNNGKIIYLPLNKYPDTEEILLACNTLVCDWSSIAFDFLLLNRPTIFLDVPAPFKKGYSLGPDYRFGEVVTNIDQLKNSLSLFLAHPEQYNEKYIYNHNIIKQKVYDLTNDGKSAERYSERLTKITNQ